MLSLGSRHKDSFKDRPPPCHLLPSARQCRHHHRASGPNQAGTVSPLAKPPQNAPRGSGTGKWLLLGFLVAIGLLLHAISTRRALSPPPVEVRRALPADTGSPAGIGTQRMVMMPDGSTVWTTFKGYLTDVSLLAYPWRTERRYVGNRRQLLGSDNSAGFFPTGLGRPAR